MLDDDRDAAALSDEQNRLRLAHAMGRRSVYTDLKAVHDKPGEA